MNVFPDFFLRVTDHRWQQIQWRWRRVRAMSLPEIFSRIKHSAQKTLWRRRRSWIAPPPISRILTDAWRLPDLPEAALPEKAQLLEEAKRYLSGEYDLLNVQFHMPTPNWHLDVETGTTSPMTFAFDIDYRQFELVGNIKNVWELNRHRHITVLAAAFALTGEEIYAKEVERQLQSWIEQNPFPLGVNWHSSLELGVRLIAWVWTERLLRGSKSHVRLFGPNGVLWGPIYWHQWLIVKNTSCGSSANNHLVGELAGLFIAATVWPYFTQSQRWQSSARRTLELEISRQTFPSGLNRELAFSYHRFSLELFILVGLEADRAGMPMSTEYKALIKKMIEVIPMIVDVSGNLPRFGDEDGGTALQLRPHQSSMDWIIHLGYKWAQSQVRPRNSVSLAAELIWPGPTPPPTVDVHCNADTVALADAGLYVLAANRGTPSEIFCLADAGPLGFLSIAAHGHADALSFTLSIGGQCIIVDPGTFSYFCEPHWRSYFRGTKAHNTITIDDADQSEAGGAFLWTQKADCRVLNWNTGINCAELVAEHDGYARLTGRITHTRRWNFTSERLLIIDEIQGKDTHLLEWRLHFSPECSVRLDSNACTVKWRTGKIKIELSTNLNWRLAFGASDGGWYSPGFNCKVESCTLIGTMSTQLPTVIQNTLNLKL